MKPPLITVGLVHIYGPMKGEIQELSQETIRIGRHPSNDVHFPPDLTIVSRYHAEIVREGNRFRLVDKSANGVFVNGKKTAETYLKDGDVIEFAEGGPKVSFLTQMKDDDADEELPRADRPSVQPSRQPEPVGPRSFDTVPPPHGPHGTPVKAAAEPPRAHEAYASQPVRPAHSIEVQTVAAPSVIQYGPTVRSYKQLPITIGRHPRCDFTLDDPAILDQHVQVFYSQDRYWLKDLTGQQLVRVNQQPIASPVALAANDTIALTLKGPFFRFVGEGRFAEDFQPETSGDPSRGNVRSSADTNAADKPKDGLLSKVKKRLF